MIALDTSRLLELVIVCMEDTNHYSVTYFEDEGSLLEVCVSLLTVCSQLASI